MKKRTKIVLASVLTISVVGGVAAHNKMRHGGPGEYMKHRLSEKLELTEVQSQKLDAVSESAYQAWKQLRQTRKGTLEQVIELMQTEQLDQEEAMNMVREKTDRIEQQAELMIAAIAGFTDSLDSGQRAELGEMLQHKMEHHRHRGKHDHDGKWGHGEMEKPIE